MAVVIKDFFIGVILGHGDWMICGGVGSGPV